MECKHEYTASIEGAQDNKLYVWLFEKIKENLLSSNHGCFSRIYEQMPAVAHVYVSYREYSVQEPVNLLLPKVVIKKIFPDVIYAITNLAEKKILQWQEWIIQLPDKSEDIFKSDMLDRFMDRPDELFCNGHYAVLNDFCYAEFLRYYYLTSHVKESDWKPVEFQTKVFYQ